MSYRPLEVNTAKEIKANLESIREKITSVSAGAASRTQEDIDSAKQVARQAAVNFKVTESQGNKTGTTFFVGDARHAISVQIAAETNLIIIQRRTDDLLKIIDRLTDEMETVIAILQANYDTWLAVDRQCQNWMLIISGAR